MVERTETGTAGEYLPLEVYAKQGFDTTLIEHGCNMKMRPVLGKTYRLDIDNVAWTEVREKCRRQVLDMFVRKSKPLSATPAVQPDNSEDNGGTSDSSDGDKEHFKKDKKHGKKHKKDKKNKKHGKKEKNVKKTRRRRKVARARRGSHPARHQQLRRAAAATGMPRRGTRKPRKKRKSSSRRPSQMRPRCWRKCDPSSTAWRSS